jgi:hypothetical protein
MDDDAKEPSTEELMGLNPVEPAAKAPRAKEERLHPILSNAEVRAAQERAKTNVLAERKLAAMEDIEKRETERLRIEEGLTTGIADKDEIVNFTVDLPLYADKILVNGPLGKAYWHSITYPVPRHIANSLAEQQFRAWRHEDQTEGRSIAQAYQRKRDTAINARTGVVSKAPARFDA